jgi:hypothetical protein
MLKGVKEMLKKFGLFLFMVALIALAACTAITQPIDQVGKALEGPLPTSTPKWFDRPSPVYAYPSLKMAGAYFADPKKLQYLDPASGFSCQSGDLFATNLGKEAPDGKQDADSNHTWVIIWNRKNGPYGLLPILVSLNPTEAGSRLQWGIHTYQGNNTNGKPTVEIWNAEGWQCLVPTTKEMIDWHPIVASSPAQTQQAESTTSLAVDLGGITDQSELKLSATYEVCQPSDTGLFCSLYQYNNTVEPAVFNPIGVGLPDVNYSADLLVFARMSYEDLENFKGMVSVCSTNDLAAQKADGSYIQSCEEAYYAGKPIEGGIKLEYQDGTVDYLNWLVQIYPFHTAMRYDR